MPFLVIGSTTVPVRIGSFAEGKPWANGPIAESANGVLRTDRTVFRRRWTAETNWLDASDYATLLAIIRNPAKRLVYGDAIPDEYVWGSTRHIGGEATSAGTGAVLRTIRFEIRESAPAWPVTVTISPSAPTLAIGATQQFTASVLDADGNELTGYPVVWSVADTQYGTITAGGLFTAVKGCTATVEADTGPVSDSESVTITQQVYLTFGSVTAGQQPATLTRIGYAAGTALVEACGACTGSKAVRVTAANTAQPASAWVPTSMVASPTQRARMVVRSQTNNGADSAKLGVGLHLDGDGKLCGYNVWHSTNGPSLVIERLTAGVVAATTTVSVGSVPSVPYYLEAEVSGTTIRMRSYAITDPEPAWQATRTDSTYNGVAGRAGMVQYPGGTHQQLVDVFAVGACGASVPTS